MRTISDGSVCINDSYLFVFIHEKNLWSISGVLFIVHLRVINALKCHARITQKYGVTSCRVFFSQSRDEYDSATNEHSVSH